MNIKEYVDDKTIKLDIVTVKFELIGYYEIKRENSYIRPSTIKVVGIMIGLITVNN